MQRITRFIMAILVLLGTILWTTLSYGGPYPVIPGFPLQPTPTTPELGTAFAPVDYVATVAIEAGGWPGPALMGFPYFDVSRSAPGLMSVNPNVAVSSGGAPGTARVDRLVIRVPLNFIWPPGGGKLWVIFGDNPFTDLSSLIIEGPRMGNNIVMPTVKTPMFDYIVPSPSSYAFAVVLTDASGTVVEVVDPLLVLGGVPSGYSATTPIAHWILPATVEELLSASLPIATATALESLGVNLRLGVPAFEEALDLCSPHADFAGLPSGVTFDLETGDLSGTVSDSTGLYCQTYHALAGGDSVAKLSVLIQVNAPIPILDTSRIVILITLILGIGVGILIWRKRHASSAV